MQERQQLPPLDHHGPPNGIGRENPQVTSDLSVCFEHLLKYYHTRYDRPMAMSQEEQERRRAGVKEIFPKTPYLKWLGIVFDRYEPDEVTIRLPFRAELTNDGTYYHGGVVAAVMDSAGAASVWSNHDFDKGARASTVAISIQYVGACKQSDLLAHAHCIKRAKELSWSEITATDADGKIVAHGILTYRIV